MELFTELPADLAPIQGELVRGEHVRASLALARQREVAAATAQIEHCFVEGLGQLTMRIDPDIYFRMRLVHGEDCWADKGFRESFKKRNPEVRVQSRGKIMVTR